jgi:MarR family 2-MHQ and catechol resistance regulon transcriptional repressor
MPTRYKGTAKEKRALNAFICLRRSADAVLMEVSRRFKLGGVTPTQFAILESLYHIGAMKPGELAEKMFMSCGNITYVLDRLVDKGLIDRVQNPEDRRSFVVDLEPKGKKLVEEHIKGYIADITDVMGALELQELNSLRDLSKKLGLRAARS